MKIYVSSLVALFLTMSLFAGDRSPEWNKVRKDFIKSHPTCAICGTAKSLQVHHIKPFHLYPALELDQSNLVTVCTSKYWGFNCHLQIAHGGNFKYENPWIMEDIQKMKVIGSPQYIRENGTNDRDEYLRFIKYRTKKFNKK